MSFSAAMAKKWHSVCRACTAWVRCSGVLLGPMEESEDKRQFRTSDARADCVMTAWVHLLRNGIYGMARKYAEGKLPTEMLKRIENTFLMTLIINIVEAERAEGEKFDVDRIAIGVNKTTEQRAWPSKAASFLKHADRDAKAHLVVDEVKNENVLIGACAAYLGLMRMPSPEIVAFCAFWGAKKDADVGEEAQELLLKLRSVKEPARHRICAKFIQTRRRRPSRPVERRAP